MNRSLAIILAAVLFTIACEKIGTDPADNRIVLCAGIADLVTMPSTKADTDPDPNYTVYTLTTPTTETPLLAAIWASSISGKYTGEQSGGTKEYVENGYVDYHNTTRFTGSERQLLDHQLFYPDSGAQGDIPGTTTPVANSQVYFVGLCPRSGGWSVASYGSADNCAVYTFTGKDDVMFAPEVHKSIAPTDPIPVLSFHHLLTQIHISVKAIDTHSIEPWGTIHNIRIESRNQVTIDTRKTIEAGIKPDETEVSDWLAAFSYSQGNETHTLPTYKFVDGSTYPTVEFNSSAPGVDLTTESQKVAFVLCAPVIADGSTDTEYTLLMDIGSRKDVRVPFSVNAGDGSSFSGSTAGCSFDVNLTFKVGEKISTYATVSKWENGGAVVTPVTEN